MRNALLAATLGAVLLASTPGDADACCPAPPPGKPAVNADQTVILLWDPATKTEHFVRRASFRAESDDFGFLVPTPTQPELAESGDAAFPSLAKLTEPEVRKVPAPSEGGCATCAGASKSAASVEVPRNVVVLEEKTVAGFQASVLEARSASALVRWLEEHHYALSPEVEAWAKPYVDGGWKITALRVTKDASGKRDERVAASSLRLSFKADAPLFPYREPDPKAAGPLAASGRLLRIYLATDARYDGALTGAAWTGQTVWANPIASADRARLLAHLGLPDDAAPKSLFLTEIEDPWPRKVHPSDLVFSRRAGQETVKRPPVIEYVKDDRSDGTALAVALAALAPWIASKLARRRAAI